MTRYRVYLNTTATATVYVEADSEDEAEDAALANAPTICAQCSGWGRDDGCLDLGDDWALDKYEDAITAITDEDES